MIVASTGSVFNLLAWQWKNSLWFVSAAAIIALLRLNLDLEWITLPTLPLGVVGGAIGIFVSFRTNSAYDRWWEGRKLWGKMINASRHFSSQVMAYLPSGPDGQASAHQRELIERHIHYVHVLRCALRLQDPFADPELKDRLPTTPAPKAASNLNHRLLQQQLVQLTKLSEAEHFDDFRLSNFELTLRQFLDIQGGCERIKKTPLPRGYGFIAEILIQYFAILFPMAIVGHLGWWTIPINLLVCMAFALISEAGRVLEDPFNMFYNGLPLSAMSRMIEVNLRESMGENAEELPPMLQPVDGILM